MARNKILSQDAYDYILELILSKQLLPGSRIRESQIADDLQISRTPVRAAIHQLSDKGLIDVHTNRFAQVTDYTPTMIREIGTMRLALDRVSTKLALIYGNQIDFLNLQNLANKSLNAFCAGDEKARRISDCDFHLELSRISNNSLLYKFQLELYLRVQFILIYHNNKVHDDKAHINQHLEFTEALIA
ncbi:MAG: GntR family transcriptional regulator, partial [Parabacteroides sp.]|nr:GntR family transcriptional regulator [Parabacteroides sp.]